tara:strand:- start:2535 stop:2729 length:195 start_codon:yes stop_codon:yes gene_type:complete
VVRYRVQKLFQPRDVDYRFEDSLLIDIDTQLSAAADSELISLGDTPGINTCLQKRTRSKYHDHP